MPTVKKILKSFEKPIIINEHTLIVTVSVGISVYPFDGDNRSSLMKKADIAMYRAKENGKNLYEFYNIETDYEVSKKLQLEHLLGNGIKNNEFVLYYQPQINIKDNKLIGFEALIRWNNPLLSVVSPQDFIPLAEETGIIIDIGKWVIEECFKQIKIWNEKYKLDLKVGINVSPKQFMSIDFINDLIYSANKYSISPSWIDLEITEESAMKNEEYLIKKLQQLNKIGFKISIDDFGTGYSSLAYLKQFSIDTLKIAMPFISEIDNKVEDYQIVQAIIAMAKSLGLNVIAEGVERTSQLELLKELGCDEIQGYYFGRPMTAIDAEEKFLK